MAIHEEKRSRPAITTPWRIHDRDMDLRRPLPVNGGQRVAQHVFDDLKAKILGGAYADGTPLDSERQLASDYKVARPTVRQVLEELEAEGLIEIQRSPAVRVLARFPRRLSEEHLRV